MISELRKSVNSILFERVTSPFYGTLIASWVIWNWKIIYLTFFISEEILKKNKIDYIISNYNDIHHVLTFPLLSTFVLLTLIPFISNGAFWLQLKFNKWKIDKKNEIENKQLLTLEQAIAIRKELREKEKEFEDLLGQKEKAIESFKIEINELENRLKSEEKTDIKTNNSSSNSNQFDYESLKQNSKAFEVFENVVRSIKDKQNFPPTIDNKLKEYFIVNEIVKEISTISGPDYYELTNKGNNMYKYHFNENFDKIAANK